jgi:hypothetical protein
VLKLIAAGACCFAADYARQLETCCFAAALLLVLCC